MNALFLGVGVGAGVVISHFYGAKDNENNSKAMHTAIVLGAILGLALTGIGVALTRPALSLMGVYYGSVLYDYAFYYLLIYFLGVIFVIMFNIGAGILRAVGDSVTPSIFLFIVVVLNIGLTLLFLEVFNLGVIGVAVSTIISQAVATALVFGKLFFTRHDYKMFFRKLRISKKMLVKIIRIGLPVGIHTSLIASAHIIMQRYINGFDTILNFSCDCYGYYCVQMIEYAYRCLSNYVPHANGVAVFNKIDGFVYLPMMAMGLALTTFVGQNVGADRVDRAKRAMKITLLLGLIMTVALSTIVILIGRYVVLLIAPQISIYGTQGAMSGMEVAMLYMLVVVCSYPILMCNDIVGGALRGAGRALVPSLILIVCMVGIRLLFLFLAIDVGGMGIVAVFLTFPISWGVSAICMTAYYFKTGLKKREDKEECLRSELAQKALSEVTLQQKPIGVEVVSERTDEVDKNLYRQNDG